MGVQTLLVELAIEYLNERVVRQFSWPAEIQHHPAMIDPQIHITCDTFQLVFNANGLCVANLTANPIKRGNRIFTAIIESDI